METRRRILSKIPNEEEDEEESSAGIIRTTSSSSNKTAETIIKESNKDSWKRLFLLIVIISLCLLLMMIPRPLIQMQDISASSSSSSDAAQLLPPTTVGSCTNLQYTLPLNKQQQHHKPIWIASYPGSGSEMVRDLVQALTGGLIGGSVYIQRDPPFQDCITSKAATCKTHWPLLPIHSPLDQSNKYHDKAILLIRNPVHAFASRLNHLWEVKALVKAHTKQAPEHYWNKWIQKNWKQQVKTYRQLIQTWISTASNSTSSFPYQVQLVLAYEDLTRKETNATTTITGAMAAQRLVQVLHQANARVVVGDESIACLWKHVVVDRPKMKRSDHAYIPGYTLAIKDKILDMLRNGLLEPLHQQQQHEASADDPVYHDLIRLLEGYTKHIEQNTRIIIS